MCCSVREPALYERFSSKGQTVSDVVAGWYTDGYTRLYIRIYVLPMTFRCVVSEHRWSAHSIKLRFAHKYQPRPQLAYKWCQPRPSGTAPPRPTMVVRPSDHVTQQSGRNDLIGPRLPTSSPDWLSIIIQYGRHCRRHIGSVAVLSAASSDLQHSARQMAGLGRKRGNN